jgi:hypothetical protein
LNTVTLTAPVELKSVAKICALSEVGLPYVVILGDPFHRTTEPLTKFVPVTMSGKAPLMVVAEHGDRVATVGTGLLTVKFSGKEVDPPGAGLVTVTAATVAIARSPIGIVVVSDVLLTKTVVRAAPFHWTTAPLTNFDPVTVKGSAALPAMVNVDESVVNIGAGLPTVNV